MQMTSYLGAALIGVSVFVGSAPAPSAETLRVMTGQTARSLNVPMNRAVVVESDVPFAELSIANPSIADISTLSDRTIYVLGKAPGRTTLTLLGPDGRLITNVEVHVAPDIAEFKERLRQILPGEPIEVRTANDGIVLSGTVSSIERLDRALDLASRYAPERVSNLMTVGGVQQVMLKVRFAEMERSVTKSLSGSVAFDYVNGNDFATGESGTWLNPGNGLGNPITVNPQTQGAAAFGIDIGGLQLGILLEALETKGVVRTLAEPNLSALSGQEATFLAGGEYPIPVVGSEGEVTIEYKPFGVALAFTPRVVGNGVINLQLASRVSGLDNSVTVTANGISVNAFRVREATTVVEMRDGESFAIAGLLEDDFQDLSNQVPWLGDIPVLGALFRSANYNRNQSELVVIITAHLVSPVRGEALALPTDRVRPPTESELFLFGKTVGSASPRSGAAGEVAKQDFSGSYGYVMD